MQARCITCGKEKAGEQGDPLMPLLFSFGSDFSEVTVGGRGEALRLLG